MAFNQVFIAYDQNEKDAYKLSQRGYQDKRIAIIPSSCGRGLAAIATARGLN